MANRKLLQIAFNRPLSEVQTMISLLPPSDKIIIEAGTPLIKRYGIRSIISLKNWWSQKLGKSGYIVADLKTMDRGSREVNVVAKAGANAATCLGLAPTETINEFIKKCDESGIHSMVDMLNVRFPFEVLQNLKKIPDIVVLHRGVDENKKIKKLPHEQINRIKGTYGKILISIAGGETSRDVVRTFFNNADIAVVWESFYKNPSATKLIAQQFLKSAK